MADNILDLFCLVEGEAITQAFEIEISPASSIAKLKNEIWGKRSNAFSGVDAPKLRLWIASIPNGSPTTIDALHCKTELDNPRVLLSEVFPKSPDNNTYIIVRRPPPGNAPFFALDYAFT